eukprot:NP_510107.2 Uncharacterized protein CELE_R09A8.1 [Caenorhabditis elegans]
MNNPKLGSKQLSLKTSNKLNRAILIDALPQNHTKNSSNRQNTYEPVASKKSEAFSALASSCVGKKTNPPCEIGPYVSVYGRVVVEIDDKIKLRRLMNHIPDHYSIPILRIVQFGEYNAGKKPRSLMSYRKRMTDCDYFSDALAIELLDFFEMIHNDVERANYVSRILDTKAEYYGFKSYDDRVSDIRFNKTRPAPLNTLHVDISSHPNSTTERFSNGSRNSSRNSAVLTFSTNVQSHAGLVRNDIDSNSYAGARSIEDSDFSKVDRKMETISTETQNGFRGNSALRGSSSLSDMNVQSSLMVGGNRSTDDRVNAQRFASTGFVEKECRRWDQLVEKKQKKEVNSDHKKANRITSHLEHNSRLESLPPQVDTRGLDNSHLAEKKYIEGISEEVSNKQPNNLGSETSSAIENERNWMPTEHNIASRIAFPGLWLNVKSNDKYLPPTISRTECWPYITDRKEKNRRHMEEMMKIAEQNEQLYQFPRPNQSCYSSTSSHRKDSMTTDSKEITSSDMEVYSFAIKEGKCFRLKRYMEWKKDEKDSEHAVVSRRPSFRIYCEFATNVIYFSSTQNASEEDFGNTVSSDVSQYSARTSNNASSKRKLSESSSDSDTGILLKKANVSRFVEEGVPVPWYQPQSSYAVAFYSSSSHMFFHILKSKRKFYILLHILYISINLVKSFLVFNSQNSAPPIKPMKKEAGALLPPRAVVYKLPAIKGSMKDAISAHKLLKKSYAKPIVDISSTSGDSDPEWWSDRELTADLNFKRELLSKKPRFSRKTFDERSSYIARFKESHLGNYLNSDSDTVSNEKPKTLAQLKNFSKSNLVEYHPKRSRKKIRAKRVYRTKSAVTTACTSTSKQAARSDEPFFSQRDTRQHSYTQRVQVPIGAALHSSSSIAANVNDYRSKAPTRMIHSSKVSTVNAAASKFAAPRCQAPNVSHMKNGQFSVIDRLLPSDSNTKPLLAPASNNSWITANSRATGILKGRSGPVDQSQNQNTRRENASMSGRQPLDTSRKHMFLFCNKVCVITDEEIRRDKEQHRLERSQISAERKLEHRKAMRRQSRARLLSRLQTEYDNNDATTLFKFRSSCLHS